MNGALVSFTILLTRLRELTIRMGLSYSDTEWNELVQQSLRRSNLKGDESVPAWLPDFIYHITKGEEVEGVPLMEPTDNTNLRARCVGFVECVIGGEWEDEGESQSVLLDSIGMLGAIDHEGSCYHVMHS